MYGTIAKMTVKSGAMDDLQEYVQNSGRSAPGYIASYAYQSDEDPNVLYLAVLFKDQESYMKNADSPAQDKEYRELRKMLTRDPEWHDGKVIYADRRAEDAA